MEIQIFTQKKGIKDRIWMSSCLAFSVLIATDTVLTVTKKLQVVHIFVTFTK